MRGFHFVTLSARPRLSVPWRKGCSYDGLKEFEVTRQTAFGIAAVSLGTAAVSCAGAVWLTNDLRAFGLGIIPAGVLASALTWYYARMHA